MSPTRATVHLDRGSRVPGEFEDNFGAEVNPSGLCLSLLGLKGHRSDQKNLCSSIYQQGGSLF